jgi:hypothetical protein
VAGCPLHLTNPNAPAKRDVLGTVLLSVLAGHWRYAHITALRGDGVNAPLLGMKKVVSEDTVRRPLGKIEEAVGVAWLREQLEYCTRPLLGEPWILDVDTTVKPLYGHQEAAVVGYNPSKRGRPSHVYHSYLMAELRLVLEVEVASGKEHTAKHAAPGRNDATPKRTQRRRSRNPRNDQRATQHAPAPTRHASRQSSTWRNPYRSGAWSGFLSPPCPSFQRGGDLCPLGLRRGANRRGSRSHPSGGLDCVTSRAVARASDGKLLGDRTARVSLRNDEACGRNRRISRF